MLLYNQSSCVALSLLPICSFAQPVSFHKSTGLHWSAELRRQATAHARERGKAEQEMEAGSARCTPLPPKVCMNQPGTNWFQILILRRNSPSRG